MIHIDRLRVRLPGFTLGPVDLAIDAGEFFCLLGPTGAGKTLILESLVGIITIAGGRIRVSNRDVTDLPPERRGVGIVYQDCALFPHLTVRKNIRYGLRYGRAPSADNDRRCGALVDRLGLDHLLDRPVTDLSGGEKQRVALARALATAPSVLLLDEPLAALDPCFREEIRDLLRDLHRETGITVLMVTHDFSDAHTLARRAAILHDGRIAQTDTVETVFRQPATTVVADFVGMKNVLPIQLADGMVTIGELRLPVYTANGDHRFAAIRPEHVHLQPAGRSGEEGFPGRIQAIVNRGLFAELTVETQGAAIQSVMLTSSLVQMGLNQGAAVQLRIDPSDIHLI